MVLTLEPLALLVLGAVSAGVAALVLGCPMDKPVPGLLVIAGRA